MLYQTYISVRELAVIERHRLTCLPVLLNRSCLSTMARRCTGVACVQCLQAASAVGLHACPSLAEHVTAVPSYKYGCVLKRDGTARVTYFSFSFIY